MKSIINGKIYYNNQFNEKHVLLYDEVIHEIVDESEYNKVSITEEIDAKGELVVPGFIDIHIHGYKGADIMDGTEESLRVIRKGILENGVTSFLPTTMTMDEPVIRKALDTVAKVINDDSGIGARVLGVHLEGPFINKYYKGAQSETYVIPPKKELIEEYKEIIRVVTIAPEIEGAIALIESYKDIINFSLGHTSASYEELIAGVMVGGKSVTHLFNAMTGLHHRKPGAVGAALACDCYCELIADGIHVSPFLFSVVAKAKGLGRILLITDCMRGGGLQDGVYSLGGQRVTVSNGRCELDLGTIAGSVLRLNEGLNNFQIHVEATLAELIPLVTENQARYLNLDDKIGRLDQGNYADIVIMDSNCKIKKTIVKGKVLYER